ncbi:glucoamylase S1 isoform X30 [Chelonia mydas]|uniref:glucoamylase S1 isoform X28 n=1 Tax=Chelonia mydas TaxID=8469 RepID=UPI0018A20043|nr:glucoamylase S1 isoform X28 [Chelonia mydas]XP_037753232.1 glucoamylase S1 isoform X30 [Chelonia mydas]
MKICKTMLPCILLLSVVMMAVAENITETTVPDTTGETTVAPVMETTVPDTTGETTVAPVTEATVPDTTGETTVTIVHKDNNVVKLPLGPEKEQQSSGLEKEQQLSGLGDVMAVAENITEATVPDTTGKTTVAPVTETTVPDTTGETTVAPVTEATVPDTTGETTVTIVHKDNNVVKLPLGPEKEQQSSGLEKEQQLSGLGDVMAVAENITEATVPDTTGKTTVAPVTETTVPDTTGETTVAPVTEATVPDTTGETTVTIVHKDNNVVKLPLGPEKEQQSSGLEKEQQLSGLEKEQQLSGLEKEQQLSELEKEQQLSELEKEQQLSELEKEQQLSGLVIGLSIFFGILFICGVIICCFIWKKSRKSSFDLNSVEVTIPLNPIETKEPS